MESTYSREIFRVTVYIILSIALVFTAMNLIIGSRTSVLFFSMAVSSLYLGLFFSLKRGSGSKTLTWVVVLFFYVLLVVFWHQNGGLNGSIAFVSKLFILVIVVLVPKPYRLTFTLAYITLEGSLIVLEQVFGHALFPAGSEFLPYHRPYASILTSLGIGAIVYIMRNGLEKESDLLQQTNLELTTKNKIISEQNEKINQANNELEQKVSERTASLAASEETLQQLLNALKEKEGFLRYIIDNLPMGIMVFNEKGTLQTWNLAVQRIFEVDTVDPDFNLLKDPFTRYYKVDTLFHKAILGETTLNHEILLDFSIAENINVDRNSLTWLNISMIACLKSESGSGHVIALFEDITERKRTEMALRQSEASMTAIINSSSDFIALFDQNRELKKWNTAYEHSVKQNRGLHPEVGMNIFRFLPEKEVESLWMALFDRAYAGEKVEEYFKLVVNEQTVQYLEFFLHPIYEEGQLIGVSQFTRDVTQQRASEIEQVRSEIKLQTVLNHVPLILWAIDLQGTFTLSKGKKVLAKLGLKEDMLVGESVYDLYRSFPEQLQMLTEAMETRSEKYMQFHQFGIDFDIFVNPSFDEEGNFLGLIGISLDVSERNATQNQLKRNQSYLKSIIENTRYAIWAVDRNHCMTLHNQVMKNYCLENFGKAPVNGEHIGGFLPEDLFAIWDGIFEKTFAQKRGGSFEYELFNRYFDITISPISLDDQVEGMAVFSRETTQRRQAVKLMEERQRFIDLVVETIPGSVYLYNPQSGIFTFLNRALPYMDGVGSGSGRSLGWDYLAQLCHPEDASMLKRHFQGVSGMEVGKVQELICRFVGAENKYQWLLLRNVLMPGDTDTGMLMLGVATDVTSLREHEIKLQELTNELALATQIARLGTGSIEAGSGQLILDDQARAIFHLGRQQVFPVHALLEGISDNETKEELIDIFEGKSENYLKKIKLIYYRKAGEKPQYIEMIAALLKGQNRVVMTFFDVTGEMEKKLKLKEKNDEVLESTKKMAEYKLMALRSVMNPHFLFNSLNSIQYFISKNERREALVYLSLFSKLIRKIINTSISGTNTLADELDTIRYYVELEQMRFENKFDFYLHIDNELEREDLEIPSLVIQPFVENAILHGINNKQGKGTLSLSLKQDAQGIICTVEDDGVGREEAIQIKERKKMGHQSVGMMVTKERLEIINRMRNVTFQIEDLHNDLGQPTGTRVEIFIAIN
jgi:PAS domain S-box-containing protein